MFRTAMGSLIVARSRNQWGSIVVDVGCPRDESHRLGDVAPPFFQSLNGWRSASFADQSLSDQHRGNGNSSETAQIAVRPETVSASKPF